MTTLQAKHAQPLAGWPNACIQHRYLIMNIYNKSNS